MNSYQRVVTALQLSEPDRVPVIEFVIDPRVWQAIDPEAIDTADFCVRAGLDSVGCGAVFRKVGEDGPYFTDEWGVTYKENPEVVKHPVKGPISSLEDLRTYRPPDPDAPGRLGDLPELVRRYKGEKAIIFHHRAAFMWSCYLLGIDNLLMAFLIDKKLARATLQMVAEVNQAIIRRAIRTGADVIVLGDDYASNSGPLMSPEVFREFILPHLQQTTDIIHEEGAYCIKHTDGNIWPILDMIVDTGADGLNPIEPAAGMDMGEVKKVYGDRICLVGNIDCTDLLCRQSPEAVRKAVKECIRAGAPGGGFMLSSSNSIHSSVKPENFMAMIAAAREFGRYPISIQENHT